MSLLPCSAWSPSSLAGNRPIALRTTSGGWQGASCLVFSRKSRSVRREFEPKRVLPGVRADEQFSGCCLVGFIEPTDRRCFGFAPLWARVSHLHSRGPPCQTQNVTRQSNSFRPEGPPPDALVRAPFIAGVNSEG